MSSAPVYRFAPSPNGPLHLGHAYSALFTYQTAIANNGRFLLRIEDIDTIRSKPAFERQIYEDLGWLGLSWEQPVRRQSEHFGDYQKALQKLQEMDVVYPSFASRRDIQTTASAAPGTPPRLDPDGQMLYPALCKNNDRHLRDTADFSQIRPAWRLDIEKALNIAAEMNRSELTFNEQGAGPKGETGTVPVAPAVWGDVIIARKDVGTSYHLSCVVDDALQNITHITRGQDLFYATYIHRLLQVLLGLPEPVYHHHRLILDQDGRRLSKSAGDTALAEWRSAGRKPSEILEIIGLC